jgi:DNA-binding IclR family transcriptional regulator
LIGTQFEARTPHTITKIGRLFEELDQIRKTGVAFDHEEHTLGISAAGIALLDALANPIAISVPVPTQRFDDAKDHIADRLLETKHALQDLVQSR